MFIRKRVLCSKSFSTVVWGWEHPGAAIILIILITLKSPWSCLAVVLKKIILFSKKVQRSDFFFQKRFCMRSVFIFLFCFYTAVSVWENDCSGMVMRVLEAAEAATPPTPGAAGISEVTCMEAWLLLARENRLPLREACFWRTRWMLGLLLACWSCWLSIPWRKAFTTRIWVWRRVRPLIHKICPDRELVNGSWWWWWWWWPTSLAERAMGEVGSGGGCRPYDREWGMQLLGIVVMICCQTKVPSPKNIHQIHCSRFSGMVEKAKPPNWIMTIWPINVANQIT